MKKATTLFILLVWAYFNAIAQSRDTPLPQGGYTDLFSKSNFGAWYKTNNCLSVQARLAIVGTSKDSKSHSWLVQFHNLYNKRINFTYYIFTPQEYNEFKAGQPISEWFKGAIITSQTHMGMMGPQQYSDEERYLAILPDDVTKVYVVIVNVYFGELGDPSAPRTYASDDCGKPTGMYQWNEKNQLLFVSNTANNGSQTADGSATAQVIAEHTISPDLGTGPADSSAHAAVNLNGIKGNAANAGATPQLNNASIQQQLYQQQANAANNPGNDAIQQSLNNKLAQINATVAGNTALAQQLKEQQQQATQASFNSALSTLANTVNQFAAQQQERADMAAQRNIWTNQLRLREYLYAVIYSYSKLYMDTTLLFFSARNLSVYDPWNSGPDEWNVYPGHGEWRIKEALTKNDGIALGAALFGGDYGILKKFMERGTGIFYDSNHYGTGDLNTPYKEKIYNEAGERNNDDYYKLYLRNRFTDTRTRKELKNYNPNDLRAILPMVSGYRFNSEYFDKYVKIFGPQPDYKIITQWLYQEKANDVCSNGVKAKDKVMLFSALSLLDTAEALCNKSDYEKKSAQTVYDISELVNPEFYLYNLFCMRVGKMYILSKLSELENISADEKTYINNRMLLIYYQTKDDLAPVFSDVALQAPHQIKTN